MAVTTPFPDVEGLLLGHLGERFGGIWLHADGRWRINVNVGDAAVDISPPVTAAVRAVATRCGLVEGYDLVPVPRSWSELTQAVEWLETNIPPSVAVTWGIRVSRSTVNIRAGDPARRTAAQSGVVEAAMAALGDVLTDTGEPPLVMLG